MKIRGALSVLAFASLLFTSPGHAQDRRIDGGLIADPHVQTPAGAPRAAVFLLSGPDGWNLRDDRIAGRLVDEGAMVIGVDLPHYLAALGRSAEQCVYLVADIEHLSHESQRAAGGDVYHLPIVAGSGIGGTLALAIAAQTPGATVARTIAVDPEAVLPLAKPLCSGAPRRNVAGGVVYDLSPGGLPNPINVAFTETAPADGRAHVEMLRKSGFPIDVQEVDDTPSATLAKGVSEFVAAEPAAGGGDIDVPIVELPAVAGRDTMAIVYSGDGGWRDLDKSIAEIFQNRGVPTVGVDSLRYFWSRKPADEIARDLARLMEAYTKRWNASRVLLVGYSFGADILPATFNALAAADKGRIVQISLLGAADVAQFEISVSGWLDGAADDALPILPEAVKIDPALLQCVRGAEEEDSLCDKLAGRGVETIETRGGHHFDGDYPRLAARILEGLDRRLGREAGASALK